MDDFGYTVIELSVAVATSVLATGIALLFVVAFSAGIQRGQREAEAARAAQSLRRHLVDELRQADRVESTPSGWIVSTGRAAIEYSQADDRLLRQQRPVYTSPWLNLAGSLETIVIGDTAEGYSVRVAATYQRVDGSEGSLHLAGSVRAGPASSWPRVPGR